MFDWVVCINLERRPDRWRTFLQRLPSDWPFMRPERMPAVDGSRLEPPPWFARPDSHANHPPKKWHSARHGPWGCMRSHMRIWEETLSTGKNNVLVLEDDAMFRLAFSAHACEFLANVPDDWDQIYFGGQHLEADRLPPVVVNDHVLRGQNVNRTHCYAIRPRMMGAAYTMLNTPWDANTPNQWHVDHRLGEMHKTGRWNVYCPRQWLVGQAGGRSDVFDRPYKEHPRWWKEFPIAENAALNAN